MIYVLIIVAAYILLSPLGLYLSERARLTLHPLCTYCEGSEYCVIYDHNEKFYGMNPVIPTLAWGWYGGLVGIWAVLRWVTYSIGSPDFGALQKIGDKAEFDHSGRRNIIVGGEWQED